MATAGSSLNLDDDAYLPVSLTDEAEVYLYGIGYDEVYVGSNGFVTFGDGDTDWNETTEEHFDGLPRIAVFWDDLDPAVSGWVSFAQLVDRLVITWRGIPEASSSLSVTAQLQLLFDSTIVISWEVVEPSDGLVGLSAGTGMPLDYLPSDLSDYPTCDLITCYYDSDDDEYGAELDQGHYEDGPLCGLRSAPNTDDCDDTNETIYPGAPEIEDDEIDQDCDGVDATCCLGQVGDVNGDGGAVPTIGDVTVLIDHLFINQTPIDCYQEADVNQSGGRYPSPEDITIGDISKLVDILFLSGGAPFDCL
jgi:hypothetical protein